MERYLTTCILISILYAVWAAASLVSPNKTIYPNGPRPLALFGNFFYLSRLNRRPDQQLLRIARKYGEICMLWYGMSPVIIVSSPNAAKELMDKVRYVLYLNSYLIWVLTV